VGGDSERRPKRKEKSERWINARVQSKRKLMFSEDEKSLTELIKAFRAALQTPPSDCPTFVFRESVYFKKDLFGRLLRQEFCSNENGRARDT
jgi:hypothetical protein